MPRLRVLISSHEFSPEQGSECAVGWNIATLLAQYHDVTVLCADGPPLDPGRYRKALTRYWKRYGALDGLRVVFVSQPLMTLRYASINRRLMRLTGNVGWQILYYMGLDGWHRAAFQTACRIGFDTFDVVHQLTPISFLRPGYLWKAPLPFFWGPVGGMYKVPGAFARSAGARSYLFESLRSANIDRQIRFYGVFKHAVQRASKVWTITRDEDRIVRMIGGAKTQPMIDSAPPADITGHVRQFDGRRPLRLCWSGRLESRKALPYLLYALAGLGQRQRVVLDILGEGPEMKRWKALSRRLSLKQVRWHGRLPFKEALETVGQADVLVHTSFREGTPMVVQEALGWGLPVICHDACGMAVAVTDACGIKVPFVSPGHSIRGFREAVSRFLQSPCLVEKFSQGALCRAAQLSWNAKVRQIAQTYGNFVPAHRQSP